MVSNSVSDGIKQIPQYEEFLREGHLEWPVIKEMDDSQLAGIIERAKADTIYLAFPEKGGSTKTRTYRIAVGPSYDAMPAGVH